MWFDILLLARLEIKRLKHGAAYWLRLLGFESNDSRLYQAYIAAFWSFWAFTIWAFVIEQVELFSYAVTVQEATAFLDALPGLTLMIQIVYLVALAFDPPLKLRAPDLAYTAASPVSRGAITVVHFIRTLLVPAIMIALGSTLGALFFAWNLTISPVGLLGFQAFCLTFPLVYLGGAFAWMGALVWQNRRANRRYILVILIPAILIGAWPGHFGAELVQSALPIRDVMLLLGGLLVAVTGLTFIGIRVQMTLVMDHSQLYARIQKMGSWGQVAAPDVIARLRQQARLAQKRRFQQRLPATFTIPGTLFGQNLLILVRLSPGLSLRLIMAGMMFSSLSLSLVKMGGVSSVQTWLLLVMLLLTVRPHDAMRLFRAHQPPFLRQFLPENNLLLFISQTTLPLLLMGVGVSLTAFMQPWIAPGAIILLATGILFALMLAQALATVHVRYYMLPDFSYELLVILGGLLIVGPGYWLHSVWAAVAATILVDILLALLLYHSTATAKPTKPA
ncbi:MAG: hypothetical protein JXA10_11760 [Anaerolineae bacterium]|nr:hypothetical protein [Anaerolineae bacterium]